MRDVRSDGVIYEKAFARPLAAIAGTTLLLGMMHPLRGQETLREQETFLSGGKEIRVENFTPKGRSAENLPSIVVLHGAPGVAFANQFIAGLAQQFAEEGFVVHLVHYFDRTGTRYADDAAITRSSALWLGTVKDTVAWVHKERPKAKIGIFGYSLGGYLAAAEGVSDPQVSAAVILSGGLDDGSKKGLKYAPPMLILHGGQDTRVPVSEAHRLERALQKAGGQPEFHLYPDEEHIMSMMTYADVVQRGTVFFQQHL